MLHISVTPVLLERLPIQIALSLKIKRLLSARMDTVLWMAFIIVRYACQARFKMHRTSKSVYRVLVALLLITAVPLGVTSAHEAISVMTQVLRSHSNVKLDSIAQMKECLGLSRATLGTLVMVQDYWPLSLAILGFSVVEVSVGRLRAQLATIVQE